MASVAPAIIRKDTESSASPEVYDRVLTLELRADLERGLHSALTQPLVYLGSFAQFPDDEE